MLEMLLYLAFGIVAAAIVFKLMLLPKSQFKHHDPADPWGPTSNRKAELGMEATDLNVVAKAEKENLRLAQRSRKHRKMYAK